MAQSDERLTNIEGHGLERLAAQLYEERNRIGVGDFGLTQRIDGYWDRRDTEIDLVALNEDDRVIRFGTCKRNAHRLVDSLPRFRGHVQRFLDAHPRYRSWKNEIAAIAPRITSELRADLRDAGVIPQDLPDLVAGL